MFTKNDIKVLSFNGVDTLNLEYGFVVLKDDDYSNKQIFKMYLKGLDDAIYMSNVSSVVDCYIMTVHGC